jgi:hypothetical protein
MIKINGETVQRVDFDYGVTRDDGTVVDYGDDLLGAALEASTFGGTLKRRKVFTCLWTDNPQQPEEPKQADDEGFGR